MSGGDLASRLRGPEEAALLARALDAGGLELVARGISMRPLLRSGDRVHLAVREPRLGAVALVALDDRIVLHRLVRRRTTRWLVRGDARTTRWLVRGDARTRADGWIDAERILALATGFRRAAEADDGGEWHRLDRPADRWRGLAFATALRSARRLAQRLRGAATP